MVLQAAAMNDCIMPDVAIVSDYRFCFLIRTMYNGSILNINFISDSNTIYITSYNRIKPNAALITDFDIADNCSILGQKTGGANFGFTIIDK